MDTISKNQQFLKMIMCLDVTAMKKSLQVFSALSISVPSHCRDWRESKAWAEWPASLSSQPWNWKS